MFTTLYTLILHWSNLLGGVKLSPEGAIYLPTYWDTLLDKWKSTLYL